MQWRNVLLRWKLNVAISCKLLGFSKSVLLGVELHIRNYESRPPYHCHMFFDVNDILCEIDNVNSILDHLYPKKIIYPKDKAPMLEEIIRNFDKYDYLLLPHGGQSHSTFDKSIDRDVVFDSTMERNIYYNQFDGFTARDNHGLEDTIEYFKRLGINEFVNLTHTIKAFYSTVPNSTF